MQPNRLTVARFGRGWAIKHNDSFLGHVASEAEAWTLAERLVDLSREDGRLPLLALADRGAMDLSLPLDRPQAFSARL